MEELTQHRTRAPVRLRFVLDSRSTDLALPAEAPLVDVLPAVLPVLDPDAVDLGGAHDGWVVARVTGPPLDEEQTPAQLNLVDGETLYLRTRAAHLPPVKFDDIVDGVAQQVRDGADAWTPSRSAALWLTLAAVAAVLVVPVLALGGPDGARAVAGAGVSVVLLLGAGLASRAAARPAVGAVLAGVAAICAGAAGWFGTQWAAPIAGWPTLVAASAIATLACLGAGLALVADASLLFAAAMTLGIGAGLPAMTASVGALEPQHAAAVGLVVTLIGNMFLPVLAFRLAGLRLPLLPSNTQELTDDVEPVPHELVVTRGAVTVRYLTALGLGLGSTQVLLAAAILLPGGVWPTSLALAAAMWLMLRSRHMSTTVQRWAVVTPAVVLAVGAALRWTADQDFFIRIAVILPILAALGGVLAVVGSTLPGRRLAPYWGRGADLLELFVAIAILPILGAVLNVYEAVRAMVGG